MNHFQARAGGLYVEDVPLARIAKEVGTPTYVYSTATLTRHLSVVQAAFTALPSLVCYSVKACSNLAVLRLFAQQGAGFDIVSMGELGRVQAAGGTMQKVVFAGVGKREDELRAALEAKILLFNVESAEELALLDRVGRRLGVKAPFALRVNPEVDAGTHRHIATSLSTSKFGVPMVEAAELYRASRKMKGVVAKGVDFHIGSQVTTGKPFSRAVAKAADFYRTLKAEGLPLTHLDVGGGLGVRYTSESPPSLEEYSRLVREPLVDLGATVVLEPGRVLVANAGVLLTRVLYRKQAPARRFVVVDAAMNDLIRPALYEAYHDIKPVKPRPGRKTTVDVVGPVCESTDVLGAGRSLPPLEQGDLLAVMTAGAYGMSMASTYNSRLRPAEVLVDGKQFRVVRQRDVLEDLWRGETR
jgi:diaminopimelate decarboxylase